jgi:hypothetical protein
VAGTAGAHILLSTTPAGTLGSHAPRSLAAGQSVSVSGQLLPADTGRRIDLQWSRNDGPLHHLASVQTLAGGLLPATGWRPQGRGTFSLWASYPAQPGGLIADSTSCPLRFSVR